MYVTISCSFQVMTAQLVLATDFYQTFAKVTFQDGEVTWDRLLSPARLPNYPVRIGFLSGSRKDRRSQEYRYSFLDMHDTDDLQQVWLIQNIHDVTESSLTGSGISAPGHLYYQLSDNDPDTFVNPAWRCRQWLITEQDSSPLDQNAVKNDAMNCPCSLDQVQTGYFRIYSHSDIPTDHVCYVRRDSGYGSEDTLAAGELPTPRCCYNVSSHALNANHRALQGWNLYQRYDDDDQRQTADDEAYGFCCGEGVTSSAMCLEFLDRRPVSRCTDFVPPATCEFMRTFPWVTRV